jgi:hypothetical protein
MGLLFRQQCILPLLMLWTAPVTGIAMCQIAINIVERLSLLLAINGPSGHVICTSALPPTADIRAAHLRLARYCTVAPAGRSLDSNSSTARRMRFHTA